MKYFMVAAMLIACGDKEGDSGEESEEVEEATEEEQCRDRREAWVYRCLTLSK